MRSRKQVSVSLDRLMVSDLSRHCEQQGLVLSHVIEEALLLGLRDMGIAVRTFAGVINEDEDDQHDDDNS